MHNQFDRESYTEEFGLKADLKALAFGAGVTLVIFAILYMVNMFIS